MMPAVNTPRILLADDDADVLLVTRTRLEVSGFDVVTAADGRQALDRFKENRPDLVLLDLCMPLLDGYQVCKILKSDPATACVPVIVFSASSSHASALARTCTEIGADDHVRKPFQSQDLLNKIKKCLSATGVPTLP
jgi:CheY-like chemotaxis protein